MTLSIESIYDLVLLIISSFLVSLVITPVSIWLAKKLDIINYPGKSAHHIQKQPTPQAGGLAILFSLVIIILVFRLWANTDILKIFLPALVILSFGLWDDRFGMNAPIKLFGQICAVTLLVISGIRVQFFENPQFFISISEPLGLIIDVFITYFWIIAITNAFNLIDSMDGLALGTSLITILFFLVSAFQSGQEVLLYLSLTLLGINLGIYLFNRYPAKTFLGDSGAQTLGFILSVIAIFLSPKALSQSSTWFVPIIVFGVPIFDTTLVTISRMRKGLPFYKAQLDHTYHRLVGFGWTSHQAVSTVHLLAIFNGVLSYICIKLKPLLSNILFFIWLSIFFFLLFYLEKHHPNLGPTSKRGR